MLQEYTSTFVNTLESQTKIRYLYYEKLSILQNIFSQNPAHPNYKTIYLNLEDPTIYNK